MGRVLVVGSANTDMVVRVPRLPGPGETVLGGEFVTVAGGKGANQAVAAARAGAEVELIACVGEDELGSRAVEGFRREGLSIRHLRRTPDAPSGVALILVDAGGENCIAVAPGANALLRPEDLWSARAAFQEAEVVLIQLEVPLETVAAAVEIAAGQGALVVLNPAPAAPLSDDLLASVDVLTPNESEAAQLSGVSGTDEASLGEAATRLLARGVGAVVVTLGARGVLAATSRGRERVPALVVDAVDSTAAGDVFNGALAAALAGGAPLPEAIRFANAAAAISVTRPGAQPSAPTRAEIERMLRVEPSGSAGPGPSRPKE